MTTISSQESTAATNPAASAVHTLSPNLPLRRDNSDSHTDGFGIAQISILGFLLVILLVALILRSRLMPLFQSSKLGSWMGALTKSSAVVSPKHSVKILSSTRLTPRSSLYTVQWRGKEYLIGCNEQTITLLDQQPIEMSFSEPSRLQTHRQPESSQ